MLSASPEKKKRRKIFRRIKMRLRQWSLFTRRRSGSLVKRFQWVLLIWGVAVCTLALAGSWWSANHLLSEIAKDRLQQIAEFISQGQGQTFGENFQALDSYLASVDHFKEAIIFDANHQDIYRFSRPDTVAVAGGSLITPFSKHADSFYFDSRTGYAYWSQAISYRKKNEGDGKADILLVLDFGSYQQLVVASFTAGGLVIAGLFLIAAWFVRRMIRSALQPLLSLQAPLHQLARGDADIKVNRRGDDEIVAISRALSSTIHAIRGRDQELRRLADYDALTGLINKRSFCSQLESERRRVFENKDVSALLFIDLDQFKYVNDTAGHAAGDRLLIQVAELLTEKVRTDDIVARLGGDEFAVLAKSVNLENAQEVANSLLKAMQDFVFIDAGQAFNIYCSIGVVLIEDQKKSADELLSDSDIACNAAKSKGRNRFELFESLVDTSPQLDIGWSSRITDALVNDRFVLHFQPLVATVDQLMPSFEVLLRLNDRQSGLVAPGMFITVAERFGLALEIDYWVIRRSMKILEQYNNEDQRLRFFINLSGQVFSDPAFISTITDMLGQYEVDPKQIVFEVTERAAIGNIQKACEKINELKSLGFQFAIDDFGSGYSSFSYLKHLPVDNVKIEGELIARLISDSVDRALVKSMIDVAKACGKTVIAEFVSDSKTHELLKSFGVDYVQGYFFGVPLPEPRIVDVDIHPGRADSSA